MIVAPIASRRWERECPVSFCFWAMVWRGLSWRAQKGVASFSCYELPSGRGNCEQMPSPTNADTNAFAGLSVEDTGAVNGSPGKTCSICCESKPESAFSKKQWAAKAHSRKCTLCVESGAVAPTKPGAAAASTAPAPWYDENVGVEFQGDFASMIFEPEYEQLLERIATGEAHPDDVIAAAGDDQGTTLLQAAAAKCDLPMIKAVLRLGARVDRFNSGGNVLQMLCGMLRLQGDHTPAHLGPRSRVQTLEFLLSIGADPNAVPDLAKGDSPAPSAAADAKSASGFLELTPLHQAVQIPDVELAKRVCELLVVHKADPTVKAHGKTVMDMTPSNSLRQWLKALVKSHQGLERPARRCPCGSGLEFLACHGAPSGVPLHPKAICLCAEGASARERYGQCCLAQGKALREVIPDRPALLVTTMEAPGAKVDEGAKAAMDSFVAEQKRDFMRMHLGPLVARGLCDPAYAYAAARTDFMVARPWRNDGVPVMPKAQMEERQRVWNAAVDEYIAGAADDAPLEQDGRENREDLRDSREIEVASKVSWTGGPLYTTCAHAACGKVEATPGEFALCSRCKQARFCSKDCQTAAWKTHKQVCGTNAAEPRLSSEVNVSEALCQALLGP